MPTSDPSKSGVPYLVREKAGDFLFVQKSILTGAFLFFGVQILPHWWPWLLFNPFAFFYPLMAAFVLPVVGVADTITLMGWIALKDPNTRQRCRQWCLTFSIALVIAVACTLASEAYSRGLPMGSFTKSFDSKVWIDPASEEYRSGDITSRQKMLGDVIRSVVKNGTRENIISQLGKPIIGRLSSPDVDTTYRTGMQRDSFLAIDSEWLSIWFDESGHVTRWKVWSD